MITGVFTADLQAIIRLMVHGPAGQQEEIDGVIDTGFDGSLTLPAEVIARLDLVWRRRGRAVLANGGESVFDIHEGIVVWDGEPRRIALDAAETDPLVGMALMYGYDLRIQVVDGGTVAIEALP